MKQRLCLLGFLFSHSFAVLANTGIDLTVGGETGTVDSGLAVPLVQSDSSHGGEFETIVGGKSGEDWESLVAPEYNDWRQAGSWLQAFSAKESNATECTSNIDINDDCPEGTLMNVSAKTVSQGAFEVIVGGESGEPWEALAHVVDDSNQNGNLVQSFSQGSSSSVDCGTLCQEGDIHSVTAETVSELIASSASAWSSLYPRDGDHVIRFYADGRNNPDDGIGGGPSNGSYSKRTELSDNRAESKFTNGDERFYTLSFWAPSEIWDNATKFSTVISQWKQFGGGNPNFEVRLNSTGNYDLTFRSVEHSINELSIGTAVPDQWNDLKYYVKHSEASDGRLVIWLNGEEVYSYEGRTLYKAGADGYIKFGMYTEFRDERILLFDGVRISNSLSGKTMEAWASDQQHLPTVVLAGPSNETQIEQGRASN